MAYFSDNLHVLFVLERTQRWWILMVINHARDGRINRVRCCQLRTRLMTALRSSKLTIEIYFVKSGRSLSLINRGHKLIALDATYSSWSVFNLWEIQSDKNIPLTLLNFIFNKVGSIWPDRQPHSVLCLSSGHKHQDKSHSIDLFDKLKWSHSGWSPWAPHLADWGERWRTPSDSVHVLLLSWTPRNAT